VTKLIQRIIAFYEIIVHLRIILKLNLLRSGLTMKSPYAKIKPIRANGSKINFEKMLTRYFIALSPFLIPCYRLRMKIRQLLFKTYWAASTVSSSVASGAGAASAVGSAAVTSVTSASSVGLHAAVSAMTAAAIKVLMFIFLSLCVGKMEEAVGFEPTVPAKVRLISSQVP
jgi:hypothetical protein